MKAEIKHIAVTLPDGSTYRGVCPACGSMGTFTTTLSGGTALYNCYRASCELSGGGGVRVHRDIEARALSINTPRYTLNPEWSTPEHWIDGIGNEECYRYMVKHNMLTAYTEHLFRPMYDTAENRFVYPIKDSSGAVVGAFGRALDNRKPKVYNYNGKYTIPFICGKGDTLYIVEDGASAVAVTRKPNSVGLALLGTYLRKEFIPRMLNYKKLIVALDADAYTKSFNIKRELSTYHNDVEILRLTIDIKDDAQWK